MYTLNIQQGLSVLRSHGSTWMDLTNQNNSFDTDSGNQGFDEINYSNR